MKSMSFTVFSYNAAVLLIQSNPTQPITFTCAGKCDPTRPNPTQPMDGPNPCPSLNYSGRESELGGIVNLVDRRQSSL